MYQKQEESVYFLKSEIPIIVLKTNLITIFGVSRMDKNNISKNKKYFLGYLAFFSIFSLFWVVTLVMYMMFRMYFGKEPDFYHLGVLAGMTGGLWGYGMTKLSQIVRDLRIGNIYHTEKSFRIALLIFVTVLIVSNVISINFTKIITYFNLD